MKNYLKVLTLMSIIFFSFAIFGCGVSKEEHDKTTAELNKIKTELEQAKAKITELTKDSKIGTEVEEKLRAFQEKESELKSKLENALSENDELKKKTEQMQSLIDQLKQKLKDLQDKAKGLSGDLLKR